MQCTHASHTLAHILSFTEKRTLQMACGYGFIAVCNVSGVIFLQLAHTRCAAENRAMDYLHFLVRSCVVCNVLLIPSLSDTSVLELIHLHNFFCFNSSINVSDFRTSLSSKKLNLFIVLMSYKARKTIKVKVKLSDFLYC